MPNEVTRLAQYVDTMKANPAIAQREAQHPIDGIAALASQMYGASPKPKAPVSYPEGTALMKAVANTPERASGGLAEVFSQAAKNPKLAPYVHHLIELAKQFKAEHPDATEAELGQAVFSSAPPEIKQAILDLAYEHTGEEGYAKGGKTKGYSEEQAKQNYLDKIAEERAKIEQARNSAQQDYNASSEEQAKQNYAKRVAEERAKIEQARTSGQQEFNKAVPEIEKQKADIARQQSSDLSYKQRMDELRNRPIPEPPKFIEPPKPSKPALTPAQYQQQLAEQTRNAVDDLSAKRIPSNRGIGATEVAQASAEIPPSGVGTTPAAATVPGGAKAVLTRAEATKAGPGTIIGQELGSAVNKIKNSKVGSVLGKMGPFLEGTNNAVQFGLTGKEAYDLGVEYARWKQGEISNSAFLREAAKFGVNVGALKLAYSGNPYAMIASIGLGVFGDRLVDATADTIEDHLRPEKKLSDLILPESGIATTAQANPPAAPAPAAAPAQASAPQTRTAALKPQRPNTGNATTPAPFVGPPAPPQQPLMNPSSQPIAEAPAEPQYDESLPYQAIEKIKNLYGSPVQYSPEIMDILRQGKRNEMLNTAIGMLAGTGAGLSQRNLNEGLSQANMLAGNAFMNGMSRADQAENQFLQALYANQNAPVEDWRKAADTYFGMQSKAAERAGELERTGLSAQAHLLGAGLGANATMNAAQIRANTQKEIAGSKEPQNFSKSRVDYITKTINSVRDQLGKAISMKNSPNYVDYTEERKAEIDNEIKRLNTDLTNLIENLRSLGGEYGFDLGIANDTSLGQPLPSVGTMDMHGHIQ